MKTQKYVQKTDGFTLVEILAAINVAAILMAIAIPRFYALLPGIRLSAAARQVATDLQLARMRAIAQRNSQGLQGITIDSATTYRFTIGADTRDLSQLYPGTTITPLGTVTFTSVGAANATAIVLTNNGATRTVTVNAAGKIFTP